MNPTKSAGRPSPWQLTTKKVSQRDTYRRRRKTCHAAPLSPAAFLRLGLRRGRGALPEAVLEAAGHRLHMAHAPGAVRTPAKGLASPADCDHTHIGEETIAKIQELDVLATSNGLCVCGGAGYRLKQQAQREGQGPGPSRAPCRTPPNPNLHRRIFAAG